MSKTFWVERFKHSWAYILIFALLGGLFYLVGRGFYSLFKKPESTSSTAIKKISAGGTANITNINYKPEDTNQGLYVALGSDKATVGVYKQFAERFEIQLGAGQNYDGKAVAEVTAKVKF